MTNEQPQYVPDKEAAKDGFSPDQDPEDHIEVYGPMPFIVEGAPFEAKSGTIKVAGEDLELPPEVRQTAQVVELGKDGELHGRPANPSERGGRIKTGKTNEPFTRTHKRSSHK